MVMHPLKSVPHTVKLMKSSFPCSFFAVPGSSEGSASDASGGFGRNVIMTGNRIDLSSQETSTSRGTEDEKEAG